MRGAKQGEKRNWQRTAHLMATVTNLFRGKSRPAIRPRSIFPSAFVDEEELRRRKRKRDGEDEDEP